MQNINDYNAGWTTSAINPKTGKKCSGGAARNMRIAQQNGITAIQNGTIINVIEYIQPLVQSLQNQLSESMALNQKLMALLVSEQKGSKFEE